MEKAHNHNSTPQVECEKCGGAAKLVSASYPQAYECVCTKCNHKFRWVRASAESYD
jgi:hypothetical protein